MATPSSKSERAAVVPPVVGFPWPIGGTPPPDPDPPGAIGARRCPVCGRPLTGRQTSACSNRCRAAKSRRWIAEGRAQREQRVRDLLEAALRVLVRVDEPAA
jgi:endogenous inhibitor of DNA gyrase (YacG/DUF329 family)